MPKGELRVGASYWGRGVSGGGGGGGDDSHGGVNCGVVHERPLTPSKGSGPSEISKDTAELHSQEH